MADSQISLLNALSANPADTDLFVIVDVSDTTMGATGTNKKLAASYLATRTGTETLTNKTLTAPVIATISNSGTLTLPTSTDTLVGRATTDTLTNKTLTSPVIATIVNSGTLTLPTSTDTLVGRATTDTLTNKTLTEPTIASFANATHTHADAAGGGTLSGYLAITGATTGATSQAQTFTNGIIGPTWKPASDSTTALRMQTSGGTAVITVDTTNSRVGIGTTPTTILHAYSTAANTEFRFQNVVDTGSPLFTFYRARGTTGAETSIVNGARVGEIQFRGYGTTDYQIGGFLRMTGNATWTDTSSPTDFYVMVTPSGSATPVEVITAKSSGQIGLGSSNTSPSAVCDLAASTTSRASFRIRSGTAPTSPNAGDMWNDGALTFFSTDATTNAVVNTLVLRRASSGTPAAGFGAGFRVGLASSTTANQDASLIETLWQTATHASRASDVVFSAYNVSTKREFLRGRGGASNAQIGFLGATPVSQQTSGANLTNNVTSGGTDDTIDNWTDLTTYATDAAAIRNAVYQLSRKMKQINDGLRTLGLFT